MSGLVHFDRAGAIGPAATLIFNVNSYNSRGLSDLSKVVKENFFKLAHRKPQERKAFCANILKREAGEPMTPMEVVRSPFFSSMMHQGEPLAYHSMVLEKMVPDVLATIKAQIPDISLDQPNEKEVSLWLAGFLESYMTFEQIESYCKARDGTENLKKIMEKRTEIGKELYQYCLNKDLSEKDIDLLCQAANTAVGTLLEADHLNQTMHFTGKYLELFAMSENPQELSKDVLEKINTIMKKKVFS